ncbi:MAG: EamA family transporter [Chloroflexi bacterium]|nr:EamA family transporter [Chloroflexota bacterium]
MSRPVPPTALAPQDRPSGPLSPAPPRSDSLALWLVFGALSAAWGSSFLFIKIGLEEGLPPLTLVTFRLLIAVVFLSMVLRLTGGRLPRQRGTIYRLAALGLINVAIPFGLITWGELWIPSALASILNGLVPLFTIVIAALLLRDEPITANRLAGLAIGFVGAILLLSPQMAAADPAVDATMVLLGELAVVVASLSYAFSVVYIRRSISGKPLVDDPVRGPRPLTPVETALPQCLSAVAIIGVLALVFERPNGAFVVPPTLPAWFAVGWLGIVGSGIAYLLFFRLISAWGATRTTLVTYVMPVVGIALGVIVLGERLDLAEVMGAVLVIGGLVLANSSFGQRRLFGREAAPAGGTRETREA